MPRKRHPNKTIERVLRYAESQHWRIEVGGSHAWGKMYCPRNQRDCRCGEFCITCIWSTPKNPTNHSKQLERVVDHCSYTQ